MQYKQFIPDELMETSLIEATEMAVVENLRASLAADDDPANDDHEIQLDRARGKDALGRNGIWFVGTVDAEPEPYPEVPREEFEVAGAVKAHDDGFELPTDYEADDPYLLDHLYGKGLR
ncbi:hypothetical protein SEA_JUMBO_29 [Gordonia phage Jumbo]|uniref:Uncharacterized protein n=1 Tax=Gordonia phage Jumbo TaxID=1887650 RepID=A0A1B3B0I3_9CAUD|nr:hypothetical protein BIZ69_gp029 [Gordonia phage Jumbo]AOE44540.1 hypothetical protein SEA_JUMBO_29 [Gordonia phage Jumbo]